jgi:hypothetical protein
VTNSRLALIGGTVVNDGWSAPATVIIESGVIAAEQHEALPLSEPVEQNEQLQHAAGDRRDGAQRTPGTNWPRRRSPTRAGTLTRIAVISTTSSTVRSGI